MSRTTIVDIPPAEQAHILAEVRRARYGYVLALHICCCAPPSGADRDCRRLFRSRSTVYRVVKAYRAGQLEGLAEGEEVSQERSPRRLTVLVARAQALGAGHSAQRCRACVGGVAPGGVAPRLRWNCTRGVASRCRPRRCAGGCMNWTGCGSGPS